MSSLLRKWCFIGTSLLAGLPLFSQQEKFDETNTGIDTLRGGISTEELENRDRDFTKFYNRFKQGRASTTKLRELGLDDGRVSGILELHDLDFDGRTDHPGSFAALEKTIEESVVSSNNLQGSAWENAHNKARIETKECRDLGQARECYNISSVIVTYSKAHPNSEDNGGNFHKVYTVAKKVADAVKDAGEAYAERVFIDATAQSREEAFGNRPVPPNVRYKKGRNGQGQFVYTNPEGQSRTVDIQPSIDALRAEASWLMQQMENNFLAGAQTIRAGRLAGINTQDPTQTKQLQEFGKILAKDPTKTQEVSRRIAEKDAFGSTASVCTSNFKLISSSNPCEPKPNSVPLQIELNITSDDQKIGESTLLRAASKKFSNLSEEKVLQIIKSQGLTPDKNGNYTGSQIKDLSLNSIKLNQIGALVGASESERLYDEARKESLKNPETQKKINESIAKIEKCMSVDSILNGTWCNGPTLHTSKNGKKTKPFEKITGDPGAFFEDTRELAYASAYRASIGPAENFLNAVTHGDFNSSNGGKLYNDMKDSYEKNIRDVKNFKSAVNRAIAKTRADGINVTDSFNSNYDERTMSFKQLSERNVNRDAVFMSDRGFRDAIENQAGATVNGGYTNQAPTITNPGQGATRFQSENTPYIAPNNGIQ